MSGADLNALNGRDGGIFIPNRAVLMLRLHLYRQRGRCAVLWGVCGGECVGSVFGMSGYGGECGGWENGGGWKVSSQRVSKAPPHLRGRRGAATGREGRRRGGRRRLLSHRHLRRALPATLRVQNQLVADS